MPLVAVGQRGVLDHSEDGLEQVEAEPARLHILQGAPLSSALLTGGP